MAILDMFLFDVDKLLVWVSKFNPTRVLTAICRAGVDMWNHFRKWFFGLNFDHHEWAVQAFMPLMPQFTFDMEDVIKRQTSDNTELKLEDCLELDMATEQYYNEELYKEDDKGNMKMEIKSHRRQIKKIRAGMVEAAIRAVEKRIRNRHSIYGDDMNTIDEQAVRLTAADICGEFKINENDSNKLIFSAAYRAMTPDQTGVDALKLAYNPVSQDRRALVSAIRRHVSCVGLRPLGDF
nr:replicase-associated protein [Tombusviridae sp.]